MWALTGTGASRAQAVGVTAEGAALGGPHAGTRSVTFGLVKLVRLCNYWQQFGVGLA